MIIAVRIAVKPPKMVAGNKKASRVRMNYHPTRLAKAINYKRRGFTENCRAQIKQGNPQSKEPCGSSGCGGRI